MRQNIIVMLLLLVLFGVIQILRLNRRIMLEDAELRTATSRQRDFSICLYGVKHHIVTTFKQDYDPNYSVDNAH
uniref:Uncharacterized protein n=1 Tax=Ciona savignyi TaxID=51511 RepID=H2Y4Z3_CIOSA